MNTKNFMIAVGKAFLLFLVLYFGIHMTSAIFMDQESDYYADPEYTDPIEVDIAPGGNYTQRFDIHLVNSTLWMKWEIPHYNGEDFEFWIENEKGKRFEYFQGHEDFRAEFICYLFEEAGTYKVVWKSNEANQTIHLRIPDESMLIPFGYPPGIVVVYTTIIMTILAGLIISRKKNAMISVELTKGQKIVIMALVIVLIFFTFSMAFEDQTYSKHHQVSANDTLIIQYQDQFEELNLHYDWNVEGNTTIQFWIEDSAGTMYRFCNCTNNIGNFMVPKDGGYKAIFKNWQNRDIDVNYVMLETVFTPWYILFSLYTMGIVFFMPLVFFLVHHSDRPQSKREQISVLERIKPRQTRTMKNIWIAILSIGLITSVASFFIFREGELFHLVIEIIISAVGLIIISWQLYRKQKAEPGITESAADEALDKFLAEEEILDISFKPGLQKVIRIQFIASTIVFAFLGLFFIFIEKVFGVWMGIFFFSMALISLIGLVMPKAEHRIVIDTYGIRITGRLMQNFVIAWPDIEEIFYIDMTPPSVMGGVKMTPMYILSAKCKGSRRRKLIATPYEFGEENFVKIVALVKKCAERENIKFSGKDYNVIMPFPLLIVYMSLVRRKFPLPSIRLSNHRIS